MSNLAYAHKYHVSPKMLLFQSLFGHYEMDYSTTCYYIAMPVMKTEKAPSPTVGRSLVGAALAEN